MQLPKSRLIEKIMSHSLNENMTSANTSSKNEKTIITAAETQSIEKDGAPFTLPLSIGPSIQSQQSPVETVTIQRYEALQNEYAAIKKRYNLMYDAFAEMRIELDQLRKEKEQAWARKK